MDNMRCKNTAMIDLAKEHFGASQKNHVKAAMDEKSVDSIFQKHQSEVNKIFEDHNRKQLEQRQAKREQDRQRQLDKIRDEQERWKKEREKRLERAKWGISTSTAHQQREEAAAAFLTHQGAADMTTQQELKMFFRLGPERQIVQIQSGQRSSSGRLPKDLWNFAILLYLDLDTLLNLERTCRYFFSRLAANT